MYKAVSQQQASLPIVRQRDLSSSSSSHSGSTPLLFTRIVVLQPILSFCIDGKTSRSLDELLWLSHINSSFRECVVSYCPNDIWQRMLDLAEQAGCSSSFLRYVFAPERFVGKDGGPPVHSPRWIVDSLAHIDSTRTVALLLLQQNIPLAVEIVGDLCRRNIVIQDRTLANWLRAAAYKYVYDYENKKHETLVLDQMRLLDALRPELVEWNNRDESGPRALWALLPSYLPKPDPDSRITRKDLALHHQRMKKLLTFRAYSGTEALLWTRRQGASADDDEAAASVQRWLRDDVPPENILHAAHLQIMTQCMCPDAIMDLVRREYSKQWEQENIEAKKRAETRAAARGEHDDSSDYYDSDEDDYGYPDEEEYLNDAWDGIKDDANDSVRAHDADIDRSLVRSTYVIATYLGSDWKQQLEVLLEGSGGVGDWASSIRSLFGRMEKMLERRRVEKQEGEEKARANRVAKSAVTSNDK